MSNSTEDLDRFEPINPPNPPSVADRTSSQHGRPSSSTPTPSTPGTPTGTAGRARGASASSSYLRGAARRFSTSGMPLGFFQASGQVVSSAPTLKDIQNGNLDEDGWSGVGQRRNSILWKPNDGQLLENITLERTATGMSAARRYSVAHPTIPEEPPAHRTRTASITPQPLPASTGSVAAKDHVLGEKAISEAGDSGTGTGRGEGEADTEVIAPHDPTVPYANGYQFPPKHTKMQSLKIGLRAYWRFLWTWFGFLLTVYSLNVVAWGGMLFLVLIGGAPAMCHPKILACSNKDSTKSIWIENDSQIVNALFCVTGLGLIPWRFRDLYYLLQWRWKKNVMGLRRLAGINRDWLRLPGSQQLDVHWDPKVMEEPAGFAETTFAWPLEKSPDPPLTGERAPETKLWKLDFYIWCYVWNTIFQIMLCGVMWGLNRRTRPSWTTGCLIPIACVVAAAGGICTYKEGKKVKSIEGVPVSEEDLAILREMREREKGISGGEEGRGEIQFADPKPIAEGGRKSLEEGPMGER